MPGSRWKLAIAEETYSSDDGKVKVARKLIKQGRMQSIQFLNRPIQYLDCPIQKLVLIQGSDEVFLYDEPVTVKNKIYIVKDLSNRYKYRYSFDIAV